MNEIVKQADAEIITAERITKYMEAFGIASQLEKGEKEQFIEIATAFQLNPFKREIYCIPYGKGVVGTCAKTQETQRIEDVHQFPGHIACDCASNSEICIPIKKDDKLVAILDIDSFEFNNFSKEDQAILEKICEFFIPLF